MFRPAGLTFRAAPPKERCHLLDGAATPALPRSIQSCPAGQRQNTQETAPSKTKDLSAQFLERGIPPPSKVVHYKISISLRPGRAASSGQRRHDEIIASILLVAALIVLSANRPLLSVADGVDSGLRNALFD